MKLLRKKILSKRKYIQPKAIVVPIKLGVWGGSGCTSSCISTCLHPSTLISTPYGEKKVKSIKVNDKIWTIDKYGAKIEGKIESVNKSRTSPTHYLIHLVLSDGREVTVSPLHPLSDYANEFRNLKKNEIYDGAIIVSVNHNYYPNQYTHDILPSGDTGSYWANGILMGSTLSHRVPQAPGDILVRLSSIVEFI